MDRPSQEQLDSMQAASGAPEHRVVHWQTAFGIIIIETRGEQVFVNGELVQPAGSKNSEGSA